MRSYDIIIIFFYSFIDILSTLESAGHVYTFKKKKTVYEYTYMCRKKHMKIHRQCNTRRQPYGLHFLCKKKSAIHQQHSYIDWAQSGYIRNLHTSRTFHIWAEKVRYSDSIMLLMVWIFRATTFTCNIFVWQRCLARPNTHQKKQQQYERVGKWFLDVVL